MRSSFFGLTVPVLAVAASVALAVVGSPQTRSRSPLERAGRAEPDEAMALTARIDEAYRQKDRVVDDVRAGRMELIAAAAEFRRLDLKRVDIQMLFPGATKAESYCRHVIQRVASADGYDGGKRVAPILESELGYRLARGLPLTAGE
jgi:hypothetical protein